MRGTNGKLVVLLLVGLCAAGCLGTIWIYRDLHESSTSARVDSLGSEIRIVADFPDVEKLRPGQSASVSFASRPGKFEGEVESIRPGGAIIRVSAAEVPLGEAAKVTVDTARK